MTMPLLLAPLDSGAAIDRRGAGQIRGRAGR